MTLLKVDGTQAKIRLAVIDAPEAGQDFGARAKLAATQLAWGKTVTVHERGSERYGRILADVFLLTLQSASSSKACPLRRDCGVSIVMALASLVHSFPTRSQKNQA